MQRLRPQSLRPSIPPALVVLSAGAVAALYSSALIDHVGPFARPELQPILGLPPSAVAALCVGAASVLVSIRVWWAGLALFFLWLPFEDFARKFADNDIRVFLVKSVLLAIALIVLVPRLKGCWRRPLGSAWGPLMAVLAIAFIMSVPGAFRSPQLPLVGIYLRFFFLLLVPVGVLLASNAEWLRVTFRGLTWSAIVVCGMGIAQAIVGPEFLNPAVVDPKLHHLTIVKNLAGGQELLRPAGPFVDATRFASMTTVAIVISVCTWRLGRTPRERSLGLVGLGVALGAMLVAAGRADAFAGIGIALAGVLGYVDRRQRRQAARTLGLLAVVVVTLVAVGGGAGGSGSKALHYMVDTANPFSAQSDLRPRLGIYAADAARGVADGGVIGRGTGTQTLGVQYLSNVQQPDRTESGWASVALEWGFLGLVAWCVWVFAWVRRGWQAVTSRAEAPVAPIAWVLFLLVVTNTCVLFWLGNGQFDNYIMNAFFWLFSGMLFSVFADRTSHVPAPEARAAA